MASLSQRNGTYHARFRWGNQSYKRSLKTADRSEAKNALRQIETTIHELHMGRQQLPVGVDAAEYIISGGTLSAPPSVEVSEPKVILTGRQLVDAYLGKQFTKAETTLGTERTHLKNLVRGLGPVADLPCTEITHAHLTQHLQSRTKMRHAETVKKERVTIVQLFAWACREGFITVSPAADLPKVKGAASRTPFRTLAEIEAIETRGGLTPAEAAALWKCVYLSPQEIAELLSLVSKNAIYDYGPLLFAIPAFTGMRRGEVLRLRWLDVDFEGGFVTARSRKQSRQQSETARTIDMHAELKRELLKWREKRPRGQFVVCKPRCTQPLTVDEANQAFRQPLRGTCWEIPGTRRFKIGGFHVLRHSFASNLAAAGVDPTIVDHWMGHQTEQMRRRYQHLFPRNKRAAIDLLSIRV